MSDLRSRQVAADFPKRQKDVVLAWEIIEKGAFAHVSSLGDVLDGGFQEPFLGEKIERGAEKAFADFRAATLAAIRGRPWRRSGDGRRRLGARNHIQMTNNHI